MSLGGYILQFIGLRAKHWRVAIAVLSATLVMTCTRAYALLVADLPYANLEVVELLEGSWALLDCINDNRSPTEFAYLRSQGIELLDSVHEYQAELPAASGSLIN
ncbi:hypothetical protein BDW59DRAFT_159726 [Aspergillus cavernicola]|uniref:Uncharacterized protein n=1 Tax=Aspergillus cavernicola TaxID=176166 RepID=A0ABR4IP11_9EURO